MDPNVRASCARARVKLQTPWGFVSAREAILRHVVSIGQYHILNYVMAYPISVMFGFKHVRLLPWHRIWCHGHSTLYEGGTLEVPPRFAPTGLCFPWQSWAVTHTDRFLPSC